MSPRFFTTTLAALVLASASAAHAGTVKLSIGHDAGVVYYPVTVGNSATTFADGDKVTLTTSEHPSPSILLHAVEANDPGGNLNVQAEYDYTAAITPTTAAGYFALVSAASASSVGNYTTIATLSGRTYTAATGDGDAYARAFQPGQDGFIAQCGSDGGQYCGLQYFSINLFPNYNTYNCNGFGGCAIDLTHSSPTYIDIAFNTQAQTFSPHANITAYVDPVLALDATFLHDNGLSSSDFQISFTGGEGNDPNTALGFTGGAVPEPATWALMMLGFGGLGAALRRRRLAVPA